MELTTFLRTGGLEKKLGRYQFWGLVCGVLLSVGIILLIVQQKLQNDQIELAQPDDSFAFEENLYSLPTFGQTFVPHQAGLRGVYIPLSVETDNNGDTTLTLHLRADPEATEDIRTATLSLAELEGQNLARFSFEPLPDSFNTRYYFFLEPSLGTGEARIKLHYGGPTAYIDGALYIDGEPQGFQASFFLAYDRTLILYDWGNWLVKNVMKLLSLALLATLPGGTLLVWLWPKSLPGVLSEGDKFNHIEWLALATGLSVAVYPILLLLADVVGVKFSTHVVVILLTLSTVAIIAGIYYRKKSSNNTCNGLRANYAALSWSKSLSLLTQTLFSPPILLFWLIFTLSAAIRIFVMRGQDVPLWQDSYHHTMISQLILDNGGLFDSWAPYAPIESFSYHFGFHALVAAYHWLTGSNIFQAVIAIGQFMNLLTVPAAFLLGRRLGGSHWAGTFAALITGLLSEHPMYYVNWGRYTQLTSQVILPIAMILTWVVLKKQQPTYKLIGLASLSVAGLALTHYRVLFFYPCFLVPLLLLQCSQANWRLRELQKIGLGLAIIAFVSFLLTSPWLWRVVGSKLWGNTLRFLTPAGSNSEFVQALVSVTPSVFDYISPIIVLVGIVGVIWGSWQRREGIVITAGWGLILIILANPHFLYLPGAGAITYFAVLLAAYLPFSILAGFVLAKVTQFLMSLHPIVSWSMPLLILGIGFAGALERVSSIEPGRTMVTKPDLAAMNWIRQNTPAEATFWINARLGYADATVVGTDAGWWIPFLTGRKSSVLPMIHGSEMTIPLDYRLKTIELFQKIQQNGLTSLTGWQTLQQAGITNIYIGQRRGTVWQGEEIPLDPLILKNSPYYQLVYHQDQVWIFALKE